MHCVGLDVYNSVAGWTEGSGPRWLDLSRSQGAGVQDAGGEGGRGVGMLVDGSAGGRLKVT